MMSPDRRDERGAVALVVTFMMIVLCICAAMVTDLGMAYVNKRQAQTAADAAVLAAGRVIAGQPGSCTDIAANTLLMQTANEAADDLRQENLPGSPDADLVASCSTGSLTLDYHVNVDSPLWLGQMVMGTDQINVDREAQVTLQPGGMSGGCGLCFIGTGPMRTGNADYQVNGGNIHINGNLNAGPNGVWSVVAPNGTIGISGSVSGGQFSPPWVPDPVITDPLASMNLPLFTTGLVHKTDPCTQGPGIYGSFEIPKNPDCVLSQGAYVFTGALTMKKNSVLTSSGSGVTLYFMSPNGRIDVKNGTVDNLEAPLTGPPAGAPPGWPTGFAIIYDRTNTNLISAQGNGSTTITGGIYGRDATLDFNGSSAFHILRGPVVVTSGTGNGNPGTVFVDQAVDVGGIPLVGGMQMTK